MVFLRQALSPNSARRYSFNSAALSASAASATADLVESRRFEDIRIRTRSNPADPWLKKTASLNDMLQ